MTQGEYDAARAEKPGPEAYETAGAGDHDMPYRYQRPEVRQNARAHFSDLELMHLLVMKGQVQDSTYQKARYTDDLHADFPFVTINTLLLRHS